MKRRLGKNGVHCIDWGLVVANGTVFLFSHKQDQIQGINRTLLRNTLNFS